jgi:uncharacterized Tic20 family protein
MDTQTQTSHISDQSAYIPTSDERTMAILSHVLALVANIIGPLIIYLIKKDESSYVKEHAKESLNFQISMAILAFISIPLTFIIIGAFMLLGIGILTLVCVIIASVRASDNKLYRYPLNFRLIK